VDSVSVRAVVDEGPLGSVFAEHFDLDLQSLNDVLGRDDIHAVLVHSRTSEMVDLALAAVAAGKSVLVEKPCGNGPDDIARLVAAANDSDVVVQAGYAIRTSPVVEEARKVLESGQLGEVVTVRVNGSCALGEHATPLLNEPGDIGGALFVIGCHHVDIILHLFGDPSSVRASVEKFSALSGDDSREDAASVTFRYPDKVVSFVFNAQDPLGNLESWRLSVAGTRGVFEAGFLPTTTELYLSEDHGDEAGWVRKTDTAFTVPFSGEPTSFSPDIPQVANISFYEEEARRFVKAVRGGEAPHATASDAWLVAEAISRCYQSSANDGASETLRQVST